MREYQRAGIGAARRRQLVHLGVALARPALLRCRRDCLSHIASQRSRLLARTRSGSRRVVVAVWTATANSLRAASGCRDRRGPGVAVAYLTVRFPSRYSTWVYRSSNLGNGLPGIVIALSLVFFGANYAPFIYQTLAMLLFAYVALLTKPPGRSAPVSSRSSRLEEAAQPD